MAAEQRSREDEKENKTGMLIPEWMRDLAMKILPWAIIGIIGASIGLYSDNIGTKRDVAREAWRNDQQDARHNRFEAKQDRLDEKMAEMQNDQAEFKEALIDRLDLLLEKRERRNR